MSLHIKPTIVNKFKFWSSLRVDVLLVYVGRCCTDLGDNDLELTVLRGISYNVANPKDVDTYVKFEFPYPAVSTIHSRYFKQINTSDSGGISISLFLF